MLLAYFRITIIENFPLLLSRWFKPGFITIFCNQHLARYFLRVTLISFQTNFINFESDNSQNWNQSNFCSATCMLMTIRNYVFKVNLIAIVVSSIIMTKNFDLPDAYNLSSMRKQNNALYFIFLTFDWFIVEWFLKFWHFSKNYTLSYLMISLSQ